MEHIPKLSIASFRIQNFKGIKDAILGIGHYAKTPANGPELPLGTPWIFLTGENGYGKTVVLQALALALAKQRGEGEEIAFRHLNREQLTGKGSIAVNLHHVHEEHLINAGENITFDSEADPKKEFRVKLGSTAKPPFDIGHLLNIVAYGPTRLHKTKMKGQEDSSAISSLFGEESIFFDIEDRLIFWASNQAHQAYRELLSTITCMMKKVVPDLIEVEPQPVEDRIDYILPTDDGGQEVLTWHQLSAGYRTLIVMLGNIYLRLAHYESGKEHYPKTEALTGLVLIDELELHLHPKWQKVLPALLTEVFPNVQFIASTHSPIPLLGAPKGSAFLTVLKTKADGIDVLRLPHLEKGIHDLLPNALFTSPLFDMQELVSPHHKQARLIRTEDDYTETRFNDELSRRLMEDMTPEQQEEFKKYFNVGNA